MAGLNPPALKEMIAFVRTLSGRGLAIVMVEHIMEAIIELSDHVIVLASGERNRAARNRSATTTAVMPVRPPALTPAALSI